MRERLLEVYERLLAVHGPRGWWPGAASPFEVVVGAILVQNTAWANAERALERLRAAGALSVDGIRCRGEPELAELLRPSGYYNSKARKLKAFVAMLDAEHGAELASLLALPLAELRARLLATWGIGPETADAIVLYAAGLPSFVVDAYTVRLFTRLGITPERGRYEDWRDLFMRHLQPDAARFNEYHALIVTHGHRTCRKTPRCDGCPLRALCPAGQTWPPTPPAQAGRPRARA
jgi:endonuclease-3 related protein